MFLDPSRRKDRLESSFARPPPPHYSPMITLKRPETTLKWRYCRAYQGNPELEVLDTTLERPP